MKRKTGILALIVLMLMVVPAFTFANGHPFGATITDLIANGGSPETAIDVGDVVVWNDTDNLYVQYIVTSPWCMTEIHLHIAESLEMVPQTMTNNPKPGQFGYQGIYECVQMSTMVIPLDDSICTNLVVAAHAEVERTIDDTIEPVVITEGVWGAGDEFEGKNWATYFSHIISEPEECSDGVDNDCDGYTDGDDEEDCPFVECPCYTTEDLTIAQPYVEEVFVTYPTHIQLCYDKNDGENYTWTCDTDPDDELHTCHNFDIGVLPPSTPPANECFFCYCGLGWCTDCIYVDNLNSEQVESCRNLLKSHEIWQSCAEVIEYEY